MPTRPRLHVVALAHLDTQWRWTVRDTVRRHLPSTVTANESLFERYPGYVLSFEGAHRYRLLAEYHPALFERVRERVRSRRWALAGAAVEAFDTLLPSPESLVRQILYGRRWFQRELATDSRDLFLPDCFGFPATLPTVAVHAGLIGFSTQKLRRGALMRSAFGIPFPYGRWRGPDGSELLAALDPGEYSGRIEGDLTSDPDWLARFEALSAGGFPQRLLLYVGTGDRGGSPPERTVVGLESALARRGPIEVVHGSSEQIYLETSPAERSSLPLYEGELLLRLHGTGCYTAKASLKRWNRICESLALAAESACSLALLAGHAAPLRRIERAWWAVLAHQMHDDLTGTSIPAAYETSLDDLGWAANEFSEIALDAVSAAARGLDRTGRGSSCVLLSSLATPRRELAEIVLPAAPLASEHPPSVTHPTHALGADGVLRVCQVVTRDRERIALVEAGFAGVEIQLIQLVDDATSAASEVPTPPAAVRAAPDLLENERLSARFDGAARLASLFDRVLGRELLAAPLELEMLADRSPKYPAWEIRWEDLSSAPLERFEAVARPAVRSAGPLRAELAIERRCGSSRTRELWSLDAGASELRLQLELDWRTRARLLKLRLPLAARNPHAQYDTGLGAIERPVARPELYEVPAQAWAALEDESGAFGVGVACDCRHGWDQPDPSTLRLSLVHAPTTGAKFRHQARQDFGRHRLRIALMGLAAGELAGGRMAELADRLLHPPVAFAVREASTVDSSGQRRTTLLSLAPPLRALAVKPAEAGNAMVVRVNNSASRAAPVEIGLSAGLAPAEEVDAMEVPLFVGSEPPVSPQRALSRSGLRALRFGIEPMAPEAPLSWRAVPLPWHVRGFSRQGDCDPVGFDGGGLHFPLEQAETVGADGPVPFDLSHIGSTENDTLVARGQSIQIGHSWSELWLLAASIAGDRSAPVLVGDRELWLDFPDWRAPFLRESRWRGFPGRRQIDPGRFRRLPSAGSVGHLHDRQGRDRIVERGSLFALRVPLEGTATIGLPDDPALRIVAASLLAAAVRTVVAATPRLLP